MEEFDDVARGVLEQDLSAVRSFEDVVAKWSTGAAQAGSDRLFNVVDH